MLGSARDRLAIHGYAQSCNGHSLQIRLGYPSVRAENKLDAAAIQSRQHAGATAEQDQLTSKSYFFHMPASRVTQEGVEPGPSGKRNPELVSGVSRTDCEGQ